MIFRQKTAQLFVPDGVPDGLDDCPGTLYGIDVDPHGCVDLSVFAEPMVMNIDYAPGSFEVDPNNMERLRELARILNFVPEIKLEISGFTDNIGQAAANQSLSEKRARRVRDYLVAMDSVGAGPGEIVFYVSGSSSRMTAVTEGRPSDAAVTAIVDAIDLEGRTIYRKAGP